MTNKPPVLLPESDDCVSPSCWPLAVSPSESPDGEEILGPLCQGNLGSGLDTITYAFGQFVWAFQVAQG